MSYHTENRYEDPYDGYMSGARSDFVDEIRDFLVVLPANVSFGVIVGVATVANHRISRFSLPHQTVPIGMRYIGIAISQEETIRRMPLIDYIREEEATGQRKRLFEEAPHHGEDVDRDLFLEVLVHNPEIVDARREYHKRIMESSQIDNSIYELIHTVVSRAGECEFCTSTHYDVMVDRLDISQETADAILEGDLGTLTDRQRSIVEFTQQVLDGPHRVTEDHIDALRHAGFENRDIIQILCIVGETDEATKIVSALNVH